MKIWRNKFLKQMIIIITVIFVLINGLFPSTVYADKSQADEGKVFGDWLKGTVTSLAKTSILLGGLAGFVAGEVAEANGAGDFGIDGIFGELLKELIYLIVGLGDVIIAVLQTSLLGDVAFMSSTMIYSNNDNLGAGEKGTEDSGSWLYAGQEDVRALAEGRTTERGTMLILASNEAMCHGLFGSWKVPNILYSPENIFANKIAALDANYINPHEYSAVNNSQESEREATSFAEAISPTIASWYKAFRNIAIVGLLSVLVYIGIRIIIGSVVEKARYKERLQDWFVALCLVFFMHFIMAGMMLLAENIIDLFNGAINNGIIVAVDDGTIFRTTFIGYIRFAAQSSSWMEACGYSIMYLILVGITLKYTFVYLKRALYLAFFTIIAPLVALTYPLDRIKDGKSQAFDTWIKEYFVNAIIQPVHLVLYTALVGSAMSVAVKNPVYGIVALLFISTAEQWIKKMFKIDRAQLTSTSLGDVALLGSMINTGKNIIGGIAKGAVTVGAAVATGGTSAALGGVGKDAIGGVAGKALGAGGKAVGGFVNNIFGSNSEGSNSEGSKDPDPIEFPTPEISFDNLDDIHVTDRELKKFKQKKEERERANKREKTEERERVNRREKTEEREKLNKREKTDKERARDIYQSKNNQNSPSYTGGYMEEGARVDDLYDSQEDKSQNKKQSSGSTTSMNSSNNGNNKGKSKGSEWEESEMKAKTVKKITEKSPSEEVKDVLRKGLVGTAGAVLGTGLGAIAAGATGKNEMIPATALGVAHVASNLVESTIKTGDSVFNNNVKVLVNTQGVTNKEIVKNTAQIASQEKWSEDKMKLVAQFAEKYPGLEKDKNAQEEIIDSLKQQGVTSQRLLDKAVKDICRVQKGINRLEQENNDVKKKNIEKWK